MWQSWVEIVLSELLLLGYVGHVAHMHEYLIHHCSAHEPKSFVLQHFEYGNALEIHNEMLFKIYPGLHEETGPANFIEGQTTHHSNDHMKMSERDVQQEMLLTYNFLLN